jgi:hypothetical protein
MKNRCTHQRLCILLNAVAIPCLCGWASELVEPHVDRLGQASEFPNLAGAGEDVRCLWKQTPHPTRALFAGCGARVPPAAAPMWEANFTSST